MPFPVAIFTFRRPEMLSCLLEDLAANPESSQTEVFIFSDAARNPEEQLAVSEVRGLCRNAMGFASLKLVERAQNKGCAANIIGGVSEVLRDHEAVIVLEDDLRLAPGLLDYMNRALEIYHDRRDVFSVSAFSPPAGLIGIPEDYPSDVYISRRNASWGWGTWRDRWAKVDWTVGNYAVFKKTRSLRRAFDLGGNDLSRMLDAQMAGDIDSWSIRFSYAHFCHEAYSVCPRRSLIDHTGDDGTGTHVPEGGGCRVQLPIERERLVLPPNLKPDVRLLELLRVHQGEHWLSVALGSLPGVRRFVRWLKSRFGIKRPIL